MTENDGKLGGESLVILGNGPSWTGGIQIAEQRGLECWGINYNNEQLPHILTMLFQMHGDHIIKHRFLEHYDHFPPKCPVMMHHRWDEIPMSTPFPMTECMDTFEMMPPYFACTMSYMMALAIISRRYSHIHVYGVDFYYEVKHEFCYERPNFEFYCGWAMSMGIKLDMPPNTRLFTTCDNLRQVYGKEWNPPLNEEEMKADQFA